MRRVILTILGTAAGLAALLSFKSHSASTTVTPAAASAGGSSVATAPATAGASGGSSSGSGSSGSSGTSSTAGTTVTGSAATTIYGPVQVRITVKNGKVTGAQAVEYPEGTSTDQQIDAYAIPVLNRETVTADSAKIDMVSGATYTSQGYLSSLQSALDQAALK
jgi:uncharacterized protein with FMN-binding domain